MTRFARTSGSPRFVASLKARLLLAIAIALVPIVALQVLGALRDRRSAAAAAQRGALAVARLAGAHLHLLVGTAQGYVGAAARSSAATTALQAARPRCDLVFVTPPRGIRFARIALIDTAHRELCRAGPRAREPFSATRQAAARRALATDAPSPLHMDSANRTAGFVVAAPVLDGRGRPAGLVAVEIDERSVSSLITAADLPPKSILAVIGQDGTMLFRYPDLHGWAGRNVSQAGFYRAMIGRVEGIGRGEGVDDRLPRYFGFTTVSNVFTPGRQYVTVAVPVAGVTAAANRAMYGSMLVLLVIAVAGLSVAGLFAERAIHAPAAQVERAAKRIAAGDVRARAEVRPTLKEFQSLGAAFDKMAETIEKEVLDRTAELDVTNRRLQLATRNKSEFLAEMSHELRTPLNAIIGFTQLIHDGRVGPVTDAQREYLIDVLTSASHLLRIVNELLDLTKIEAGKMMFVANDVDVDLMVKEVCDGLRPMSAERGVEITCHVGPQVRFIVGDAHRLKQILYNYLANALRFAPRGDAVSVRVAPEGEDRFRVVVEDTGPGIAAADVQRLFNKYERGSGQEAGAEGTGLGLALTRRIVEAQGGNAGVTTEPGKGAAFFAVLPRDLRATVRPELLDVVVTAGLRNSPDIPRREST